MPHHQAHPLSVVAAIIATEGLPAQTIVASNSIIGETTAPRLRRASHISPFTMLVSFVFGWISMPASAADDAPGAVGGQGFRGFVSAEGFNYGLSIYDGTHRRVILPPPIPAVPAHAAPRRRRRRHPAPRRGQVRERWGGARPSMEAEEDPYCEPQNKTESA